MTSQHNVVYGCWINWVLPTVNHGSSVHRLVSDWHVSRLDIVLMPVSSVTDAVNSLYGVTSLQTYTYFATYPRDDPSIKLFVCLHSVLFSVLLSSSVVHMQVSFLW